MEGSTTSCRSVCEAICEQRYLQPNAIALRQADRELSYEDLDRKADQFAAYLFQLGVLPAGTVALCMERSVEWIVAALGILRAGAAYVPLDAAWPDSRLQFAVKDSGATVLVSSGALFDRLKTDARGIDPIRDAAAIASAPRLEPQAIAPNSLAYVIYTSGSTGVPKGVEITHANLSHLTRWHQEAFQVTSNDRASHLAGLGFDAAVWEIWPHLAAGATLCLADEAVRASPEMIRDWMLRERVTIGFVPTVHAAPMMAMSWPETTALRFLLTGGDTLHHAPGVGLPFQVVNNYGPTECTVVSTSMVVEPGLSGAPAIGHAIAGAQVYLLDENGTEVTDDEAGEIFIGGNGVGRGYRNLDEATARSFVADPFSTTPGARMYRSGDRGVRRADGAIEFRGRLDRQAKIRGYRIELDEIGGVLSQHPTVEFAIATIDNAEGAEPRLIAYVLPKKDAPVPTASLLQEYLLLSLPRYMVPAIFVKLSALPVSANGKIDLAVLPNPNGAPLLEREASRAPETAITAIEERLLNLVRELLENDSITAQDNFFLAGGHSLLGMQLVMRLRKDFSMAFALRQLFEAPTVEGLAAQIEAKLSEDRLVSIWADLLGLPKIGMDASFYDLGGTAAQASALQRRIIAEFGRRLTIVEIQENATIRKQAVLICGNQGTKQTLPSGVLALQSKGDHASLFWVHYPCENLARAMGEDRPFLFVTLTDQDLEALGDAPAIEAMAACLTNKILATQPVGPYTLGGFCIGGVLGYEIAHQLRAAGHEVSMLVLLDTPSPIYYEKPELMAPRLSEPQYLMRRIASLGLRKSAEKVWERVSSKLPGKADAKDVGAVIEAAQQEDPVQQMIEISAARYKPGQYDGKVALLLASEHPPHVNFRNGWHSLTGENLQTQYVQGQHLELTQIPGVHRVADAINSLLSKAEEGHCACTTDVD